VDEIVWDSNETCMPKVEHILEVYGSTLRGQVRKLGIPNAKSIPRGEASLSRFVTLL
jgi:hypothetical protein